MNIWIVTYNDDEGAASVPFYSETEAVEADCVWIRHYFENDFDHLDMPENRHDAYDLLCEQPGFMDSISLTAIPVAPAFAGVTRADLAVFGWLDTDGDGNPCVWESHYRCDGGVDEPTHDAEWSGEWSCQSDDQCPVCGRSVSPHTSTFIPKLPPALEALWRALPENDTTQPKET